MKKLILLTLFTSLLVTVASAQNFNSELNIPQVGQNNGIENGLNLQGPDLIGFFANSPFLAELQGLIVEANQVARIKMEGDGNTAMLTQMGSNNVGMINIYGNSNTTSLLQDGNSLFSLIEVEGNANTLDVDQVGSELQNLIMLNGNGLNFEINQHAGGLEVTQSGSSIPLIIQGTGRLIPVIISNN